MSAVVEDFAVRFPSLAGKLKPASEIKQPPQADDSDPYRVVERLKRRFGLGADPAARLNLYRWLARWAREKGEPVLDAISEACGAADGANHPDRYFSSVVVRIMKQKLGIGRLTGGNEKW